MVEISFYLIQGKSSFSWKIMKKKINFLKRR